MLEQLQHSPVTLGGVLFVFGACVGSFLNVVILRLPPSLFHQWKQQCLEFLESSSERLVAHQSEKPHGIVKPRSECPNCNTALKASHNIPILGYLMLGGKCAFCQNPISMRYPLVELFTALATLHAGFVIGIGWPLVFALVLLYSLISLSMIDFDHQILPDDIVLPLLWMGLIANSMSLYTDLPSAVFGAISGYAILWLLYQAHHKLTGKQGMGYGDFKLLAAVGAWLGWQQLPLVLLLSSICGVAVVGFMMIFRNHSKEVPIPFGPYLAAAGWIALLWGDSIVDSYTRILNL